MKKILLFIFIVMLSSLVMAANSYEIKDVKCYGDMLLQVNDVSGSTNYTIGNCVMYSPLNYNCSCYNNTIISNNLNEYSKITVRLQYYISNVTNDDSKRVETKTFELQKDKTVKSNIIDGTIDTISFLIGGFIVLLLLGVIIAIIIMFVYGKFIKDDEKKDDKNQDDEVRKLMKNL